MLECGLLVHYIHDALFCSVQHDEARSRGGVRAPGRRDGQPHPVDLRHLPHPARGDEVALLFREQALLHKHQAAPICLGTGTSTKLFEEWTT